MHNPLLPGNCCFVFRRVAHTSAATVALFLLSVSTPLQTFAENVLPACAVDTESLAAFSDYNPCPAGFTLAIDDRFDQFDHTVWERSTGGFPDNECRFVDQPTRVRFDGDGIMRLVMEAIEVPASYSRHEKKTVDKKPCASGELRTLLEHGPYGRLEARMKSPDSSGFVQSMFTFQFYKDPWQEIDIELQGRLPDSVSTNVITNHAADFEECDVYKCTNNTEKHFEINARHSAQWHVYTIDWLPERVDFFVDGQLKRTVKRTEIEAAGGNFPDQPATLLMNFWLPNQKIAKWFGGEWTLAQLPLVAQYDWFRYYTYNTQE